MEDFSIFAQAHIVPLIVGICLCLGAAVKHLITNKTVNQFIPLILCVIGILLNVWINKALTPDILFGGMLSALCSVGTHQIGKQLLVNTIKTK